MTKASKSTHADSSTAAVGSPVLFLSRRDIASLMAPGDYLAAVEHAFRAGKAGQAFSAPPMHVPAMEGGFHVKGASLQGERNYVAVKLNGNFPFNPQKRNLPTIQGALLLCDADNGAVLAVMDSAEITKRRTAAASALAATRLAKNDASILAICGCGDQARAQVEALVEALPLERCLAWDIDVAKAQRFAGEMTHACSFEVATSAHAATRGADVIVTCTTARAPIIGVGDVPQGAFVAAVGADHPEKSEIAPQLMAASRVVVDILEQCLQMGDLHHAVAAGAMTPADVVGDLGDVLTGARQVRASAKEIVVFDSTGTALQDVASAAIVYERACVRGRGIRLSLC